MTERIDIVFDGPPSHESGRFVEVENERGESIRFGEWIHREDGYWALRFDHQAALSSSPAGGLVEAVTWDDPVAVLSAQIRDRDAMIATMLKQSCDSYQKGYATGRGGKANEYRWYVEERERLKAGNRRLKTVEKRALECLADLKSGALTEGAALQAMFLLAIPAQRLLTDADHKWAEGLVDTFSHRAGEPGERRVGQSEPVYWRGQEKVATYRRTLTPGGAFAHVPDERKPVETCPTCGGDGLICDPRENFQHEHTDCCQCPDPFHAEPSSPGGPACPRPHHLLLTETCPTCGWKPPTPLQPETRESLAEAIEDAWEDAAMPQGSPVSAWAEIAADIALSRLVRRS